MLTIIKEKDLLITGGAGFFGIDNNCIKSVILITITNKKILNGGKIIIETAVS